MTHEFVVIDPHEGVAFCGGALGCGGSRRHFPKGFPPIALYQLWTAFAAPGDIVFLELPLAVHYRRIVAIGGGTGDDPYQLFHARTTINWRDAAQAASQMENHLAAQSASVQELVEDAQERDLVQASGMRLTVNAPVVDLLSAAGVTSA